MFLEGYGELGDEGLFDGARKRAKGGGVEHVATAVAQEPGGEVKISEGFAVLSGDSLGEEVSSGGGVGLETFGGQGRFVGEENVAQETVYESVDGGLIGGMDLALSDREGFAGAVNEEGEGVVKA